MELAGQRQAFYYAEGHYCSPQLLDGGGGGGGSGKLKEARLLRFSLIHSLIFGRFDTLHLILCPKCIARYLTDVLRSC